MFSVVVPCFNEERTIRACLLSIRDQAGLPEGHGIEIIVAANGCRDGTVEAARQVLPELEARGFRTRLLDLETPGKARAMNAAEGLALWGPRLFLDADVTLSDAVMAALAPLLCASEDIYCSGSVRCAAGRSPVSRLYAHVWSRLPFVVDGVPGVGLYGVSASARRRWHGFPDLHSDDRFVRLLFAPGERHKVEASYLWPVPQGLWNLIRVRRRWIEGNLELFHRYPAMRRHDDKKSDLVSLLSSLLRAPMASQVFLAIWTVAYALALFRNPAEPVPWRRGRP